MLENFMIFQVHTFSNLTNSSFSICTSTYYMYASILVFMCSFLRIDGGIKAINEYSTWLLRMFVYLEIL